MINPYPIVCSSTVGFRESRDPHQGGTDLGCGVEGIEDGATGDGGGREAVVGERHETVELRYAPHCRLPVDETVMQMRGENQERPERQHIEHAS